MKQLQPGSASSLILAHLTDNGEKSLGALNKKFASTSYPKKKGKFSPLNISSSLETLLKRNDITRERKLNNDSGRQAYFYKINPSKQLTLNMNMQSTQTTPAIVAISGNHNGATKIFIVRNTAKNVSLDTYSRVLDRFLKPGTRRSYTGVKTSTVSFFLTDAQPEAIAQAVSAEVNGVEFQIAFTPAEAAEAVNAYAESSVVDVLTRESNRLFTQYERPVVVEAPIDMAAVLNKVILGQPLNAREQQALTARLEAANNSANQAPGHDDEDDDD